MEFTRFMAEMHPRLVPFPVVLLLAALLLDLIGLLSRNSRAHWAGRWALLAGTGTLLLAFICGICAEIWAGRAGVPHHQIQIHEFAATAASWGFIALLSWRLFLEDQHRRSLTAFLVCGFALYGLIALAGFYGGKLVTDYGAAVTGARADSVQSLHDLNILAQRQTDQNLAYSDFMHRSAGAFVLALTIAIAVREFWPHHAPKVRWVGPALLKVGGVLLFFCADLDLYALSDPRQFLDREAQMHKLISLIMVAVGLRLLWKQWRSAEESPGRYQNRIIAILALVGGGLLFTHVHTVAPYANVAAGVYLNHIVMGTVALAIGAVKLWETRWTRFFFPAFLGVESFLLLTYTEGIPWWAGVGHYNRWGANSGTIAPLGHERAELTFDKDTGQMAVRVFERFEDKLVPVDATNITVVVAQGYRETAVPLALVEPGHYAGRADFLKGALQFDARVELPGRTGYFDPWVTPNITGIPPNVVAKFVCPMHEGIRAVEPGNCQLCGMALVPADSRPRTALHDPGYEMAHTYKAGHLVLTPRRNGELVRDLQIVHEHPLHLIIVSADLKFFDHIHPVRQPDGSYAIDYRFPENGSYLLFADITPVGDRSQVFRMEIGGRGQPGSLDLPTASAREVGQYHVQLIQQPRTLVAGREAHLAFRLERAGQPVLDLEPYIGALGHCVVISEDTQTYLHSHPEQFTPTPPPHGGPVVAFHTTFPRPGRYKVWGQFRRGTEIIVADFVVEVKAPLIPQWIQTAFLND